MLWAVCLYLTLGERSGVIIVFIVSILRLSVLEILTGPTSTTNEYTVKTKKPHKMFFIQISRKVKRSIIQLENKDG